MIIVLILVFFKQLHNKNKVGEVFKEGVKKELLYVCLPSSEYLLLVAGHRH